jgi:tryptophan halogenase
LESQQNNLIKKVVVAGGGTAGWMAAAAIAKLIGGHLGTSVTLVESEQIGTIGVGEATIPSLHFFHSLLGINEARFVNQTNATFKLGINFENWRDINHDYFHAFGVTGKESWACGFQHFWLKAKEFGIETDYGEYNLEWRAAKEYRFGHLANSELRHAYHFDSSDYAKFLRRYCDQFDVHRVEGMISKVNLDSDSGNVKSLSLKSGQLIEGDLFIDCTGQRALLIDGALGVEYQDWGHWLPCDKAIAVQTKPVRPPVPFTRSIAHDIGWQWQIPLQHRVGNGLVYSSRHCDQAGAMKLLGDNLSGELITEPRQISFRTGRRTQQWAKNCVAIGLSSGFLEPLESTSIHLIQSGIIRLLRMFPYHGIEPTDVYNYNKETIFEIEHIRDFIIMHYHITDRDDSEFWRHCKTMEIPDSLQNKIQAFRKTGRVFLDKGEMFEDSWQQVFIGQGLTPEQYHPIINTLSEQEIRQFLDTILSNIDNKLSKIPLHAEYLGRFSNATPRTPS